MCLCKVGVVNCSLLDFGMEVDLFFFFLVLGEAIFTCEFPYLLHCSYLVLAKHFEIPLLKRERETIRSKMHYCSLL